MNAEQRSQLLRERFKVLYGRTYVRAEKPKPKAQEGPKTAYRTHFSYGVALCEARCAWVGEPDAQIPITPLPKRTKRVSPLVKMAEQLHQKLLCLK
jgi:hypothetical protein